MKPILTITLFCLIMTSNIFGQYFYTITFDGTGVYESSPGHKLFIDSISNPSNVWQIGQPQKSVFTNSVATSKAIVTKSLTTYPVNNTSSFVLSHVANLGFSMPAEVIIGGKYFVNSDSLTDYGKIEFSPDNGATWIDLIANTTYASSIFWINSSIKPSFSGNSNGWKKFRAKIDELGPIFNIQYGDTVKWKFTFTSDGIETNKDGLMFDSLSVYDAPPIGMAKINPNQLLTTAFPNPSQSDIFIEFENNRKSNCSLLVYNNIGQIVFEKIISKEEKAISINIKDFADGVYTYTITDTSDNNFRSGKFIKTN
jgi:Secretion system C-terminal sorting domain